MAETTAAPNRRTQWRLEFSLQGLRITAITIGDTLADDNGRCFTRLREAQKQGRLSKTFNRIGENRSTGAVNRIQEARMKLSEEMNSLIKEVEKLRDDSIPIMAVINWSKEVSELEAKLAKKTTDFRAFREARIGHGYITHSEELEAENGRLRELYEYAVNPCALISLFMEMQDYFGAMSVHSDGGKHSATIVSLLHQLRRIREGYKQYLKETTSP